jgi:hypothetical protein
MHNDHSSSSSVNTLSRKSSHPCQGLLLAHAPVLALAQAAAKGAM